MSRQKLLPLSFKPEYAEEDFCISGCNMEAFRIINRWPEWPSHSIIIYGPKGSGKTHLAKIWQQKTKALPVKGMNIFSSPSRCFIAENIENSYDEVALFHIYNATCENNGFLLMTSNIHPANLKIKTPDLRSRLNATNAIHLGSPDKHLLESVFVKLMSDRQISIKPNIVDFIISQMEPSFSILQKIVNILDIEAMANKQKITIPFVKQILGNLLLPTIENN